MAIDPAKVAIYIRWSTDDQTEGTTLETQRERCFHYALSQGLGTIPEERIFVDDGHSGGSLNRPGIAKIRKLVKQGKIHCVVVYRIDRLSRNIVDAVDLVLREWDGICQLACATEPIDTASTLGRTFFSILATFAEHERQAIRERTHSGKVRRAQAGRNPGTPFPYGYAYGGTPGSVEVVEAQAAVVRRIFELYEGGLGGTTIAQRLNSEGTPTARGAKWAGPTIVDVISNPAYTGRLIYGKTRVNPRFGKDRDAARYIKRDKPLADTDMYPPLISKEAFERCQAIREGKVQSWKGRVHTSPYLLTGVARCGKCGHALFGRIFPSTKAPVQYRYYQCSGKSQKGATVCDAGSVLGDDLDAAVIAKVMELVSPENKQRLIARGRQRTQEALSALDVRLADVETELAGMDGREARAKRDYMAQKLPPELYAEIRDELKNARQTAATNRAALHAELEKVKAKADDHRELERRLAQIESWDDLSMPTKKQLLSALSVQVSVYRPKRKRVTPELDIKMKGLF